MSGRSPSGISMVIAVGSDNSIVAMGFKRYGFAAELNQLATALFDAARAFPYYRLPELFCGFARRDDEGPTHYPVACSPQAPMTDIATGDDAMHNGAFKLAHWFGFHLGFGRTPRTAAGPDPAYPRPWDVGTDGYLFFRVDPVETAVYNDTIDFEIRMMEGPQATYGRITVSGNDKTKDYVVLRELRTVPGDKFSRSDIMRT